MTYWRVKLSETVAGVTMEGWIRHIPANEKREAAEKALLQHMTKNQGSRPSLVSVELEDYSKPIVI